MGNAIEALRSAKPVCMGSLFWQLNDLWPVVSWSSVDFYGEWKALQYRARDLYDNLFISCKLVGNEGHVTILNDNLYSVDVKLIFEVLDLQSGNNIVTFTFNSRMIPGNS